METLLIANGDLGLSGGQLATIDGPAKIEQDLAVGLLTPFGSNPYHPGFGSTLSTMVGQPDTGAMAISVPIEVQRVVANYMAVQQNVVNIAATAGEQSPYAQNELIGQVVNIGATQNEDEIDVAISLLTIAGEALNLSTAITPSINSAS